MHENKNTQEQLSAIRAGPVSGIMYFDGASKSLSFVTQKIHHVKNAFCAHGVSMSVVYTT